MLTLLSLLIALPAHAYEMGKPFDVSASNPSYYGGPRTAEAGMWEKAFAVCKGLEQPSAPLVLNRVSEVTYRHYMATDSASATFICLAAGNGN